MYVYVFQSKGIKLIIILVELFKPLKPTIKVNYNTRRPTVQTSGPPLWWPLSMQALKERAFSVDLWSWSTWAQAHRANLLKSLPLTCLVAWVRIVWNGGHRQFHQYPCVLTGRKDRKVGFSCNQKLGWVGDDVKAEKNMLWTRASSPEKLSHFPGASGKQSGGREKAVCKVPRLWFGSICVPQILSEVWVVPGTFIKDLLKARVRRFPERVFTPTHCQKGKRTN